MKLVAACTSCTRDIPVKPTKRTRLDLSRAVGREIDLACPHCSVQATYPIDAVEATLSATSWIGLIVGLMISGVLTYFLWHWGWISMLTFSLPAVIYLVARKEEDRRIDAFNLYRLKGDRRRG